MERISIWSLANLPKCRIETDMSSRNVSALRCLINEVGPVDQVGIEERVAKYATRSIKKDA